MGKSLAEQLISKNLVDGKSIYHLDGNPENNDPNNIVIKHFVDKKNCFSPTKRHHPKFCLGCKHEEQCIQHNLIRKHGGK
jgi:hypothetical protein